MTCGLAVYHVTTGVYKLQSEWRSGGHVWSVVDDGSSSYKWYFMFTCKYLYVNIMKLCSNQLSYHLPQAAVTQEWRRGQDMLNDSCWQATISDVRGGAGWSSKVNTHVAAVNVNRVNRQPSRLRWSYTSSTRVGPRYRNTYCGTASYVVQWENE